MTSFSDDFSRADGPPGSGWVLVSGLWVIASSQLSPGTSGATVVIRAATAMATSDHYAQIAIAATTPVSQGVWCRGDATLTSGYMLRNDGTSWGLFKIVAGAFTSIGTYAAAAVAGDVARAQAVGSTITGWVNGVIHITVTDTSVTSGTGTGLRAMSTGGLRFDNFAAADVVTGAPLGIASGIEAAQALTGGKAAALGTAAEIAGTQVLVGTKGTALTSAAESGTAQLLTGAKAASVAVAAGVETAQPLTGRVAAVLGTAVATETALTLIGYLPGGVPLTGTAGAGIAASPVSVAGVSAQAHANAGMGSSSHSTGGSSS